MKPCKNCGNSIKEDDKYCSSCGQKNLESMTVKAMLGELANAFLSWDSKLFKTLVPLIIKPGKVSLEYISGKRKQFVAPLRLYLFFSVVFFFTLSMLGTEDKTADGTPTMNLDLGVDVSTMNRDTLVLMIDHDRLDELEEIKEIENSFFRNLVKKTVIIGVQSGSFRSYLQKNISVMFFIFIPVFGWILRLFFRKKQMDYIQHLVYGVYFHSFVFLMMWITLLVSRVIGDGIPLVIGIGFLVVYLVMGLKRFYQLKTGKAILKSVFITLVYLVLFFVFATLTTKLSILVY